MEKKHKRVVDVTLEIKKNELTLEYQFSDRFNFGPTLYFVCHPTYTQHRFQFRDVWETGRQKRVATATGLEILTFVQKATCKTHTRFSEDIESLTIFESKVVVKFIRAVCLEDYDKDFMRALTVFSFKTRLVGNPMSQPASAEPHRELVTV